MFSGIPPTTRSPFHRYVEITNIKLVGSQAQSFDIKKFFNTMYNGNVYGMLAGANFVVESTIAPVSGVLKDIFTSDFDTAPVVFSSAVGLTIIMGDLTGMWQGTVGGVHTAGSIGMFQQIASPGDSNAIASFDVYYGGGGTTPTTNDNTAAASLTALKALMTRRFGGTVVCLPNNTPLHPYNRTPFGLAENKIIPVDSDPAWTYRTASGSYDGIVTGRASTGSSALRVIAARTDASFPATKCAIMSLQGTSVGSNYTGILLTSSKLTVTRGATLADVVGASPFIYFGARMALRTSISSSQYFSLAMHAGGDADKVIAPIKTTPAVAVSDFSVTRSKDFVSVDLNSGRFVLYDNTTDPAMVTQRVTWDISAFGNPPQVYMYVLDTSSSPTSTSTFNGLGLGGNVVLVDVLNPVATNSYTQSMLAALVTVKNSRFLNHPNGFNLPVVTTNDSGMSPDTAIYKAYLTTGGLSSDSVSHSTDKEPLEALSLPTKLPTTYFDGKPKPTDRDYALPNYSNISGGGGVFVANGYIKTTISYLTEGVITDAEVDVLAIDATSLTLTQRVVSSVSGTVEIKGLYPGKQYFLMAADTPTNQYKSIIRGPFTAKKMVWDEG